jgi:hypothetical protein
MNKIRALAAAGITAATLAAASIGAAAPAHAARCGPLSMFMTCMPPIEPQPQVWVGSWCDQGSGILDFQTLNFERHAVSVAWDDQPPLGVMQGQYAFQHAPGPVDVTIGIDGAFRMEHVVVPACEPVIA